MNAVELKVLVGAAVKRYEAMTPEQQADMWKRQREGIARAEASWPRPKFKMVNGVKVYESYEDYCNG